MELKTRLLVAWLLAPLGFASAWGTDSEDVTHVVPIYEGLLPTNNRTDDLAILQRFKDRIGAGGSKTKLGFSFSSWSLSREIKSAESDFAFDPTQLEYALGLAEEVGLPILIHSNNGRWADCCTSNSDGGWNDALLDHIAENGTTTQMDSSGKSLYGHLFGSNFFSFSRLNDFYRQYKKRNVQQSMKTLLAWAEKNPNLFVGVSLDSETIFPGSNSDYNPIVVEEWKQWLQHSGIYGPGGDYFGQGRVPMISSIDEFNNLTGQSFGSWDDLAPPTKITGGERFSEEWHRWRITLIQHMVDDTTMWIAQAGVPRYLIHGHQTPEINFYEFGDDLPTATAANGNGGVTMYGWEPVDIMGVDAVLRGDGTNTIGNFELNPLSSDDDKAYKTMKTLYEDGYKIITPNAYEVVADPDQYALFGSPNFGDTWGNAVSKFISDNADSPRLQQPPSWNPGNRIYDFFDEFDSASESGPDNRLEEEGSSGNVRMKTIYSAVGGKISYSVKLPSVDGDKRLNVWTAVGVADGAGSGGAASWQITIEGQPLLGSQGLTLAQNYWAWKRWTTVMTDITSWAGSTVTIELSTTGENTYGWTQWGAPGIYESVADQRNNLALGKQVTASSNDGDRQSWDVSFVTDGDVYGDSLSNGPIGWTSKAHTSEDGNEYVQIDLGSELEVSRVALHPRSDLGDASGSGFPASFRIEGSSDGNDWKTLSKQEDYGSQIKAGKAEVIIFPSQPVRYVRVTGTKLRGVAGESVYRMQFGEISVYT